MAKTLLLLLFISISLTSFGQKKYSINGTIKDGTTGEQLIGATIRVKGWKCGTFKSNRLFLKHYLVSLPGRPVDGHNGV